MDNDYFDYKIKIIFVGDINVGKTNIISRFIDNRFDFHYDLTLGVDFNVKFIDYNNKIYKLHIWDTAGQEKFKTITKLYYKDVTICFFVFSLNDINSLVNINEWIKLVDNENIDNKIIKYLIGNKCDLPNKINKNQVSILFPTLNYIETSAKENINIKKIFLEAIRELDYSIEKKEYLKTVIKNNEKKEGCCYIL